MWVTHLGCIKGCLEYLGVKISSEWLYGGTGHAFILNISKDLCPSGPTAWNTEILFKLGKNLGYRINGVTSYKKDKDFREKQEKAYELVKDSINKGYPCYGWELDIPKYYVIYGYDDEGYLYTGVKKGHKKWWEQESQT